MPSPPRPPSPPALELNDLSSGHSINAAESYHRPLNPARNPPRKSVPPQLGTYAAARMQGPPLMKQDNPYRHSNGMPYVRNNLQPFYHPLDDVAARDFAGHFQGSTESTPRAGSPTKKSERMVKESEEMKRPLVHGKTGEVGLAARRTQPWITEQQPFSSPLLAMLEDKVREMLAKRD